MTSEQQAMVDAVMKPRNDRELSVVHRLRAHLAGNRKEKSLIYRNELLAVLDALDALTSPPAPSGWPQRIAALDPFGGHDHGNSICWFCGQTRYRTSWDGGGLNPHKPDCLWQNAKDAHPLLPEGALEAAFREGYDFGQADAGFDVVDASDAWRKSGTGQNAKDALPPVAKASPAKRCAHCGEWGASSACVCGAFTAEADASPVKDRFAELLELPEGWDTYGAAKIDPRAVEAARRFQDALSVAPQSVVPICSGGVQIEMHRCGFDFEVSFHPDGTVEEAYAKSVEADASPAKEPDTCDDLCMLPHDSLKDA